MYDPVGNITDLTNNVTIPAKPNNPDAELPLGGPSNQHFVYDDLYRLIEAKGQFQGKTEEKRNYTLAMAYDGIHNIVRKNQKDIETEFDHVEDGKHVGTHIDTKEETTYDWAHQYGSSHPHAPTKIGRRIYTYDLNGNQLGWTYLPDHTSGTAIDSTTHTYHI